VGRRLGCHHEVILAVAFVAMTSYELVEMRALEPPGGPWVSLAVVVHSLQVIVILLATWTVLRAWRRKTLHAEALARLMEKVVVTQEQERRRLAYDMHDGVAQLIVSAKQHLDTASDLWPTAAERAGQELGIGLERLEQALTEIRRVFLALRPAAIADGGLVAAARRTLEEAAREAGWTVGFFENLGSARLAPAVETAVFRILQEALANARRHAEAARVDVELRREADWLVLAVRDSGHGLGLREELAPGRGLGLSSMRERASLLGGTCAVERDPAGGTRVWARVPLRPGYVDGWAA
jgi:two-component system NarL family sensor kinase